MATHSSSLVWRIPRTEEPGRLQSMYSWASLVPQLVKNLPAMQETSVWPLDGEDPLEKGKAIQAGREGACTTRGSPHTSGPGSRGAAAPAGGSRSSLR